MTEQQCEGRNTVLFFALKYVKIKYKSAHE